MDGRGAYGIPGRVEREVATVRAIYAAFARRDVEAALEHLAPDVELVPQGTAERLGRTEAYHGHEGVRRYFADAGEVWEELTLHADDIRAAGGGVVVFGHVVGRTGGEVLTRRAVWVWTVRDGKAASMRVHDLGDATPSG